MNEETTNNEKNEPQETIEGEVVRPAVLAETTNVSSNASAYMIPVSIIIAGLMVSGAVYLSNINSDGNNSGLGNVPAVNNNNPPAPPSGQEKIVGENMKPVSKEDHIFGNPSAPVMIVDFSDMECPFCKRFHATLNQIMDTYGKDGKVAWVYRHFPLDQLHPKARNEAIATECATELGGETAFWNYLNKIYEITPSNNGLDPEQLPKVAKDLGLDVAKFNECLSSGRYAQKIQDSIDDAIASGAQGTPFPIVVAKDGTKYVIAGAQPVESVKATLDLALSK